MQTQLIEDEAFARLLRAELIPFPRDNEPVIVSVGGQPGAGKSRVLELCARAYEPQHFLLEVNGDAMRVYHPDYQFLVSDPDPEVFPTQTAQLSARLVERTLEWAKNERVSVMVEGTMRRAEVTAGTLDSFHRSDFKTHLVVLAVPQAFSWQGCVSRYCDALTNGSVARWAPLSAHQAGWDGVPRTLTHVISNGKADRVSIVRRDGETLFDVEGTQHLQASVDEALAALEFGRTHASTEELKHWQQRQEVIQATVPVLDRSIVDEALTSFPLPSECDYASSREQYGEKIVRLLGGRVRPDLSGAHPFSSGKPLPAPPPPRRGLSR